MLVSSNKTSFFCFGFSGERASFPPGTDPKIRGCATGIKTTFWEATDMARPSKALPFYFVIMSHPAGAVNPPPDG
jgi:hypothetical protein